MKNLKSFLLRSTVVVFSLVSFAVQADSLNKDGEWTTKVTVKRGSSHTFWVDGLTLETSVFSIEVEGVFTYKDEDGDKQEDYISASESTDTVDENGNTTGIYVLLTADDWLMADNVPSSVSFTVTVSGFYDEDNTKNNKFTFHHSDGDADYPGEVEPPAPAIPVGADEDHPASLAFKESSKPTDVASCGTFGSKLLSEYGNVYYVRSAAKLTEGRKYFFGLAGGNNVNLEVRKKGSSFDISSTLKPYTNVWTDCTKAYEFVPETSDDFYVFVLSGNSAESFTIRHAVLPVRVPEAHDPTPLAVGETSDEFRPGYLNDPESGAYDPVIDQRLFRVTNYGKGDNIVFYTEGADSDLIMRLYDKNGKVLAENMRMGDDSREVSLAWTATANYAANSTVYLGVCQNLEDEEIPTAGNVAVTALRVELTEKTTPLTVVPDNVYRSPEAASGVIASEDRALSATEWVNTFVVAARKGITYRLKALCDDAHGLTLGASLYTMSGSAKRALAANSVSGTLDPESGGWLEFTPTANGTVYIDVFVADDENGYGAGKGLEYGPYRLYASAEGASLGVLTVPMKGAPQDKMGWKLLTKNGSTLTGEVFYSAGASAVLPEGSYTIVAAKVDGFAVPNAKGYATVNVAPGTTPKVVDEYKYTDTADPLDNLPDAKAVEPSTNKKYSPAKLDPKSGKPATAARTLWAEDPADWFTIAATAGCYYKFAFTAQAGAPKLAVYGPDSWTGECDYVLFDDPESALQICAAKKGTYYVKVSHRDEGIPTDSSYTLKATMANPGVVKFTKTDVSAKDSAAYVDLPVSRTGKDGVVRVKYRTVGAQSDKDDAYYYPTNGVLTWAENDNKAQNIRVRFVPNAGWTTNKIVKVVLEPFATDDATFDVSREYPATFDIDKQGKTLDTATITIAAVSKKTPGTIRAVCIDPKKPVFTVTAGETVEIPFERVLGADGIVGVKVETVKGTANKSDEVDFAPVVTQLVWAVGNTEVKAVNVSTKSVATDYTGLKTFTLKLTALTSAKNDPVQYDKPTIASSTITVNIANEKFVDTMANYAKTVTAAANGYTVKEGKAGQWVVNADGSFYAPSKGDLTFAFSTTGKFTYVVDGGEEKTFTATAKDKTLVIKADSSFKIVGYELDGEQIALRQGLKYEASFGTEGTVKAANLPAGLKLAQDKVTKEWLVAGVPSKAGVFQTVYTTTVGKSAPVVDTVCYTVAAEGSAAGTFTGLATTFDTTNAVPTLASVTITAALGGKLSAKVVLAGKSYTFADTGYSYSTDVQGDIDAPNYMTAELSLVSKVGSGNNAATVTNWLYYTVMDAAETNPAGWYSEGIVDIQMAALPDARGNGYQEDVWYCGKVYRDNSKMTDKTALAAWQATAAKYAGYYTVSLVAPDAMPGEPRGSGYMTMTLDAKGKAKLAGKLADGTAYSGSATAALAGELDFSSLRVPLYAQKGTSVFGGWLAIHENDSGDLVAEIDASDTDLFWANDDKNTTRDGEEGFALYLQPVGGWYDTVLNLQRAYLESDLFVDLPDGEEALEEIMNALALGGDYAFVAQPSGQAVDLVGNTLSVEKQVLVKNASTKLNDWGASVNASNVKLAFKRATGIVSGTFDLWYEGTNAKGAIEQKSISGLKHEGVLLLSRGDDGYLEDDVLSSGFFLAPQTLGKRKWTGSYRFDIKATPVDRVWTDAEQE